MSGNIAVYEDGTSADQPLCSKRPDIRERNVAASIRGVVLNPTSDGGGCVTRLWGDRSNK